MSGIERRWRDERDKYNDRHPSYWTNLSLLRRKLETALYAQCKTCAYYSILFKCVLNGRYIGTVCRIGVNYTHARTLDPIPTNEVGIIVFATGPLSLEQGTLATFLRSTKMFSRLFNTIQL